MSKRPSKGDVLDITYEHVDNGEQKIEGVEVLNVVDCEEKFNDMDYIEQVTSYKIECDHPKSSWYFVILVADEATFVIEINPDTAEEENLGGHAEWEIV